jgi:hypothetical protein
MGPNICIRGDNGTKNNNELESFWKRPNSKFISEAPTGKTK